VIGRLERAIERIVEGSIAGVFRLRVQPAEIGRKLERAMLDGRVVSVGSKLAPNLYEVRLHPDDAAVFAGWEEALNRELENWLAELAYARGLATVGPIRVAVAADPTVTRRTVDARGRFTATAELPTTRSAEPMRVPPPLRLEPEDGRLPSIALRREPVTVGRAGDNDVVLGDPEISRHHARFERDGAEWWIVDLASRNGTWLNGAGAERAPIAPGDEVAFASLRYLVTPA
jgi:hypothetical protein